MNSNIAAPMNFCACSFVSLHMSLHNEDVLFMSVEDGKWEREMRGGAELQNSYILHLENSVCYKTRILCSNCIYTYLGGKSNHIGSC